MAKSNIYKLHKVATKSGNYKYEKTNISYHSAKQEVLKIRGWTSDQYQKQYDLLKNKVRAYESFKASKGVKVEKQNISELLYKESKKIQQYGSNYKPSLEMQRIQSFSAVSITKGRQLAKSNQRYIEKREALYNETTKITFEGLLNNNAKAQEIYDNVKDPVKREEALKAYAEALHAKINEEGKVQENEAIPSGETYGSDVSVDFDYSDYQ